MLIASKHLTAGGPESINVSCLLEGQEQDHQLLPIRDTRREPAWEQDPGLYSYIVQGKHPTSTQETFHALLVGNLYASLKQQNQTPDWWAKIEYIEKRLWGGSWNQQGAERLWLGKQERGKKDTLQQIPMRFQTWDSFYAIYTP